MKFFKLQTLALLLAAGALFAACEERGTHQQVKMDTVEEVKEKKENLPDIADSSWKDGMVGTAWHNYLEVQYALVNGDVDGAQKAADQLEEAFTEERADLRNIALQIIDTDDLEEQRRLFAEFTEKFGPTFEKQIAAGKIYKIHCPMAFDNQGANWYSDVAEVRNPYFGDRMLKCGKVVGEYGK